MSTIMLNPYVGSRPFQVGEQMYGRDQESLELLRLLIAERIVLLYSPSGAGKTSLIQAKLLPSLEAEGFQVLPPARVSGHADASAQQQTVNPYVASLISYWEDGRPETTPPLDDLTNIDLDAYLTQRRWLREDPKSKFLFLDQFEEILTINPGDREAKRSFFQQLGQALKNRDQWMLIAMREEYIAGLDPYLDLLPTRLFARYRLELLTHDKARDAVVRPVQALGVDYHPEALSKLLDALTTVQEPGGTTFQVDYVEPLHLQVVCDRLWQGLQPGTTLIGPEQIDTNVTVQSALTAYYRDAVEKLGQDPLAHQNQCDERRIRNWFQDELISSQGLRIPLQSTSETSGSLPNSLVRALEDRHLVRMELRHGVTWYEIAHDRLVTAIRADNAEWYNRQEPSLRIISVHARSWQAHERPGDQLRAKQELLSGPVLVDAIACAARNPHRLTDLDKDFLKACEQYERERAHAHSFRIWRNRLLISVMGIVIVIVAISDVLLNSAYREAETQRQEARAQRLMSEAADARWRLRKDELAALLAVQAYRFLGNTPAPSPHVLERLDKALKDTLRLNKTPQRRPFTLSPEVPYDDPEQYRIKAFSPNGKIIAIQAADKQVKLVPTYPRIPGCPGLSLETDSNINTLAFSRSGRYLVAVTDSGVELFSPLLDEYCQSNSSQSGRASSIKVATQSPPNGSFCLASEDSILFVAVNGNTVEQWRIEERQPQRIDQHQAWKTNRPEGGSPATAMTCAPDGRWVALGNREGQVTVLEFGSGAAGLRSFDGCRNTTEQIPACGITALLDWDSRDSVIAIFENGRIGLLKPTRDRGFVDLYPNASSEKQLNCATARFDNEPQPEAHSQLAALDPDTDRLAIGIDGLIGMWELSKLSTDSVVDQPVEAELSEKVYAPYKLLRGGVQDKDKIAALALIQTGDSLATARSIAAADESLNVRIFLADKLKPEDKKPLDLKSLIALACSSVRRNLSWSEWQEQIGEDIDYECTCPNHSAGVGIPPEVLARARNCQEQ